MGESAKISRTFKVGRRTVRLTISSTGKMVCEWKPMPSGQLTKAEIEQYRAGRDAAFAAFSAETGKRVLVVEI